VVSMFPERGDASPLRAAPLGLFFSHLLKWSVIILRDNAVMFSLLTVSDMTMSRAFAESQPGLEVPRQPPVIAPSWSFGPSYAKRRWQTSSEETHQPRRTNSAHFPA